MRFPPTFPRRAVAALASLLIIIVPLGREARAEDRKNQDPFAGDVIPDATPPAPAAAKTPAPPEAASESLGPFERLPGSAYPEWTTRGITGGSLWFSGNMHGMPWPYYPKTGIGVSGYAWFDTGYETVQRGNTAEPDFKYLVSQGRAVLRVTPTYSTGDYYLQGQIELVGNKDQTVAQPNVADVDDMWIRVGQWKRWDLQAGRFEAFEVYHFGMGMDLNTLERDGASDAMRAPPDVYSLKTEVYRQSGIGNVAFHIYPFPFLRIEALGQFGFDTSTSIDTVGVRPAAVLDFGVVKVKGAYGYRQQFPVFSTSKEKKTQKGGSAAVQVVLFPFLEFGANFAYGLVDHWNALNTTEPNNPLGDYDTAGSVTDTDLGGFLNARIVDGVVVGAGANYNHETDVQSGEFTHLQGFGAIQFLVSQHLFVKLVGAYAKAHIAQGGVMPWDNTMMSGRVRLMYLF